MSFICWCGPFIIRIFLMSEMIYPSEINMTRVDYDNIANQVIAAFNENDNGVAFVLILKNNLTNCVFNILGGATIGLATFINVLYNGYVSADIFSSYYCAGLDLDIILKTTLPHSSELIGFWLSGAIGFYIAWHIILTMCGGDCFSKRFYMKIFVLVFITLIIIIYSAYIEAFVTPKIFEI